MYVGTDQTLGRKVALKAIRAERRLNAQAKFRFLREARILSKLDHPHICRIYDYVEGVVIDRNRNASGKVKKYQCYITVQPNAGSDVESLKSPDPRIRNISF